MSLLEAFIKYLSPKTEEQFWEFRSKPDSKKFTSILDRILWNIRNKEKDGRLKELLSEAILFAINNPSEFICRKTINDSPNIALFSIIVQELHYLARKWDISYEKFVHDQTSEFSTALNFAYGLLSKVEFKEENEVMRAKKALNSFNKPKIIFKTRQSCLQLRIVDLILWTITRVSKKGYFEGYDNINNLYDLLLKKAHFSYLTPEQLAFENQFYKEKFSGEEFSAEQLDNARQYLASIEKNRKKALL